MYNNFTLIQIRALADQGENASLEFKITTAELKKACQIICGFLNATGGTVLVGVKNDGRLIGQMVTDNTRLEIANELRKFEPYPEIKINYIPINESKFVIVMQVAASLDKPYVYDGRPYQRIESSTSVMSQHIYEQLLVERGRLNYSWEEYTTNEYSIKDLDHEEIYKLVKLGISVGRIPFEVKDHSISDVLSSLDLIKDGKLKNAAMVLFAKNVIPTYSQCMLKMARFRGLSVTDDFIDNRQFYGNAFKILEEANNFMQRHLLIASYYQVDSFQRIDRPTLPVFAIREAMINAICHKNYMERSSAITIAIFDDRMEIWNCGLLPKELEIEDLMVRHKSYLRNKLIANAFYKKGFIESSGTGTVKIFDGCKEHGILPPIFEEYSGGISVTFMFAEPIQRIGDIIMKPIVK